MSLPRFLERVVDATAPLMGGLDRGEVQSRLASSSVTLAAGDRAVLDAGRAGFLLAANLAGRLYPRIRLVGPADVVSEAMSEIVLVNPLVDIAATPDGHTTATLGYETSVAHGRDVAVFARGWNVHLDDVANMNDEAPAAPAALLAAALGVAELFRVVFAEELGARGRTAPAPAAFNIVTLGEPRSGLAIETGVSLGHFRLVGAGAIGQAAARVLAVAGVRGTMLAVDHEHVALSNLQRYVLTRDSDVGAAKADLLRARLANSSLVVVPAASKWHAGIVGEQLPTLVALDSPDARIGVQASLPGPIYNAWTQPADVGWSRHESFGEEPCLACLYWPDRAVPSRHEQIASAFRQHPLRVLAHLVHRGIPIGLPLPAGAIPAIPGLDVPLDAERWLTTAIIDDIAAAAGIEVGALAAWRHRPLADVYQDGICGGALLHLNVGDAPREVLVPLAHQSAFAGIMLATQFLVAQIPKLRVARAAPVEGRFDVLAGAPQVLARPRVRTVECLCGDSVFRDVYRFKAKGPASSHSGSRPKRTADEVA